MESFEQLVEQYIPMMHKIIHSLNIYKNKEEFYQLGLIALWEASKRYDPKKGKLASYVYMYIKGYLLMELKKINKNSERSFYPKRNSGSYRRPLLLLPF